MNHDLNYLPSVAMTSMPAQRPPYQPTFDLFYVKTVDLSIAIESRKITYYQNFFFNYNEKK